MEHILPTWVIVFGILSFGFVVIKFLVKGQGDNETKESRTYLYQRKQFFMTKNEHDAFDALLAVVENDYFIFPQVKLDKILDWKGNGRNTTYAMRHINQKSIDFLICDKKYINPLLAIELDDSTHNQEVRKTRDSEIVRIFASANFPLLRITYSDIATNNLKEKIFNIINK